MARRRDGSIARTLLRQLPDLGQEKIDSSSSVVCPSKRLDRHEDSNMNKLGDLDLIDAARAAAGNWANFSCFIWFRQSELNKPENWTIIYTHNRDSGLLDQSNASVITKAMQPFAKGKDPDVVLESHHHWAVGHADGFSIRVFRRGRITKAFRTYYELAVQMADYPILDEDDYSERELEATLENIDLAAWKFKKSYALPKDEWLDQVYGWLSDNRNNALENTDDQGGWPDEDDLEAAFTALGYAKVA